MTTNSLPPLIQQMLTPDFYPHPVTEPIELLQTHISFVLLTGPYAYKLKKPVNFGFLDFSTLAKRHHFCEEEVRLNRRLAPELYLGVVAIAENDGKYSFAPDHAEPGQSMAAAEYAIKMPQFDQSNLLINLFEQGKIKPEHMIDIGKQMAQFHAIAATNDHIASFGTMAAIKAVADDNYGATDRYIGRAQTQAQFDQTKAFTDKFFAEHEQLFSDRIAQGKVKECHGDVHLKNICLYEGKIRIFDCIEFNEPFRNSDILYDAAFLLMDLQYRGRRDLANIFLNTYLEQTGDYDALPLLPLYGSMRAYIRAKVTSFLLDDPNIPEPVKASAANEAAAYYKLAHDYASSSQGKILLMSGLSGSGKSTIARTIAPKIEAIHLRSDVIRKHLAGVGLLEQAGDEIYTPEMTTKTYTRLANLATLLASQGFNVILDAKYDRQNLRDLVTQAATAQNIPWQIVYCQAPIEALKQRLGDRAAQGGDAGDSVATVTQTEQLLVKQQDKFEPFSAAEKANLIEIETTQPIDYYQSPNFYQSIVAKLG
jgi:aminoglycoside phosphotransferase family enzyme/predicted kinase